MSTSFVHMIMTLTTVYRNCYLVINIIRIVLIRNVGIYFKNTEIIAKKMDAFSKLLFRTFYSRGGLGPEKRLIKCHCIGQIFLFHCSSTIFPSPPLFSIFPTERPKLTNFTNYSDPRENYLLTYVANLPVLLSNSLLIFNSVLQTLVDQEMVD